MVAARHGLAASAAAGPTGGQDLVAPQGGVWYLGAHDGRRMAYLAAVSGQIGRVAPGPAGVMDGGALLL